MSSDAIYWIFSTLPQVLAALAGLVMASLAIIDQNLKREIDRDESIAVIIKPIQQTIFRRAICFFIISLIAIVIDVTALSFAEHIANVYKEIQKTNQNYSLEWNCWLCFLGVSGLFNLGSLILLFPLISPVINPDFRIQVRGKEKKKTIEELDKEMNTSSSNPVDAENNGNNTAETVDEDIFTEVYLRFERVIGEYFPESVRFGKVIGMNNLVKRLFNSGIIPRKFKEIEILNIVKLHNLQLHGEDIGPQKEQLVNTLNEVTNILQEKLPNFLISKLSAHGRGKYWKEWVDNNVEDFEEAYNLNQAIRFHHRYGEYDVTFSGNHIVVYSPHEKGNLVLTHTEAKDFLRYLESRFASTGFSLEDEKSIRDDLGSIKNED